MAIFEKKIGRKVYIDDTEVLTCVIENFQNINGHTEYIIRVHRGTNVDKSWHVYRRYNDFVSLQHALCGSGINLPLPPKKIIGNMGREFIAERQSALQNYLNIILMNPFLALSFPVKKFLDPENYTNPFQDVALQHVSLALRSEVNYEVVKPIPDIGWRLRKHYFLIKNRNYPKEERLLSWVENGPDKYLEDKELHSMFKCFFNLQHPYIYPIEFYGCNDAGGFVIRNLNPDGTLRDAICSAKPKTSFLKKYGNPKQYRTFTVSEIAKYGYQILVTLKFLHDKGIPYGHLHSGNIIIENGMVKLLDVENGFLGLPSYYRPYFVQHRKINSLEAIDVYSFGHVLFEMTFGHPLQESVCDIFLASCPPLLKSVLESILTTDACKGGLPSLTDLLSHKFFTSATEFERDNLSRTYVKMSSNLKEALANTKIRIESRLKEEQKRVRHQKRLAKVQELLSSEEEKKKRKQKKHKEQVQKQPPPQPVSNGKSPERSDSPTNSTSTATSAGTVTPPLGVMSSPSPTSPPPPPPPPMQCSSTSGEPQSERAALLDSICNFNKASLRHRSENTGTIKTRMS